MPKALHLMTKEEHEAWWDRRGKVLHWFGQWINTGIPADLASAARVALAASSLEKPDDQSTP